MRELLSERKCDSQESLRDKLQRQLKGKVQHSLMKMDVYEKKKDVILNELLLEELSGDEDEVYFPLRYELFVLCTHAQNKAQACSQQCSNMPVLITHTAWMFSHHSEKGYSL